MVKLSGNSMRQGRGRAEGPRVRLLLLTSPRSLPPHPSLPNRTQNPKRQEHWGTPGRNLPWSKYCRRGMKPLLRSARWKRSWTPVEPGCAQWRLSCWRSCSLSRAQEDMQHMVRERVRSQLQGEPRGTLGTHENTSPGRSSWIQLSRGQWGRRW